MSYEWEIMYHGSLCGSALAASRRRIFLSQTAGAERSRFNSVIDRCKSDTDGRGTARSGSSAPRLRRIKQWLALSQQRRRSLGREAAQRAAPEGRVQRLVIRHGPTPQNQEDAEDRRENVTPAESLPPASTKHAIGAVA
mgnify:CR=1 FL=1